MPQTTLALLTGAATFTRLSTPASGRGRSAVGTSDAEFACSSATGRSDALPVVLRRIRCVAPAECPLRLKLRPFIRRSILDDALFRRLSRKSPLCDRGNVISVCCWACSSLMDRGMHRSATIVCLHETIGGVTVTNRPGTRTQRPDGWTRS